jgi:hypothetical protein
MKTKLQTLIAKFLGIESIIQAKCDALQRDYTRAIEEVAEEANNRISEVEDAASKVDDIESKVDDIESTVEDINSANYASEDYIDDKVSEVESDLSDKMDEAVAEALEGHVQTVTQEMVEDAVKKVLTKEFILAVLAK